MVSPVLVKYLSGDTFRVYQFCSLRLLILRTHIFRRRESHFPELRSRCSFMLYWYPMKHDIWAKFCLSSAAGQLSTSTSKKRSRSIRCVSLASTLHKNLPQTLCSRRVKKKPMDLFPRVPRTDPILFIARCHGKMRVCSRPMGCKITTLMIDR